MEEEASPNTLQPLTRKFYDLTNHLHTRPPHLTSYIGVRRAGDRNDDPAFLYHTIRMRQRIGPSCFEHNIHVLNDTFESGFRVIDRLIRPQLSQQILV